MSGLISNSLLSRHEVLFSVLVEVGYTVLAILHCFGDGEVKIEGDGMLGVNNGMTGASGVCGILLYQGAWVADDVLWALIY